MAGRALNETELASYSVLPEQLARRVRVYRVPNVPGRYLGLTLGRRVLLARDVPDNGVSQLLAHELVHVRQWHQQGHVRFLARYLGEFAIGLARHRNWDAAYRSIEAEREAYAEAAAWVRARREAGPEGSDRI